MKHFKEIKITLLRGVIYTILHLVLIFQLSGCFLKQDRTTVVYGTITDQDGQPVDSIFIIIQGSKHVGYQIFDKQYTDEEGNYELVAEIPRKSKSTNVVIPFSLVENPKFQKDFKDYVIYKNDVRTNNCCNLSIGQKTKYDFQLIPK
jgi:hypothetical protein